MLLYLPIGELFNPAISGFLWAWKLLGLVSDPLTVEESAKLTRRNPITSQGIEPLVQVKTDRLTAMLVETFIDPSRSVVIGVKQ